MLPDIDPEQFEDNIIERGAEEEDGVSSDDDRNARDHYVNVGKSALRNSQFLMEDPKYGGKRSNRKNIFEDEQHEVLSDDQDVDHDDDEDDEVDEDAAEMLNEDEESDEELDSDDMGEHNAEDDSELEDDDEEAGSDEDDSEEDEAAPLENEAEVQEELKRLREEEKKMISSLNKTAQADVEKGQHVKQQLTLWDGFLDTRIRMQKAMTIANQLPQVNKSSIITCENAKSCIHLTDNNTSPVRCLA